MSPRPVLVLFALAGCASAHGDRLVARLVYDGNKSASQQDGLGAAPAVLPAPPTMCVEWKKFTLSNGIPLFVAERRGFPSAALRVVFATDKAAAAGVANGSGKLLELLAATYLRRPDAEEDESAQCTRSSCWIGERVSADEAGGVLDSLALSITHAPAAARSDIDRFAAAVALLRRDEDSPRLSLWRNAEVMALGLPMARRAVPEPTMAEVTQARAQLIRPAAATLVVVGDVFAGEVQAQAERAFGQWQSSRDASSAGPSSSESIGTSFVPRVVHVPNNPWPPLGAIVVRGPASSSPDAWAYRLAVQILGGGIESELYVHVREEMAAAYVPAAEVRWFPGESIAMFGGYLEREKVIAAIRVMLASVRALREHGPALDVLRGAKARLKAELQTSVSTNWLLASSLEVVGTDVRPLDPCEAAALIDAIQAEEVRAAMRVYFAEKRLGVVVIAREDQLDVWPDGLGIGKVQRRDWLGQDLP
jgi:zinc protease